MAPRGSLQNGADIRRNHWQVSFFKISLKFNKIYNLLQNVFLFTKRFIVILKKKVFPVS